MTSPPLPLYRRFQTWGRWLLSPLLMLGALLAGAGIFVSLASRKEPPRQVQPLLRVFRVPVYIVEQVDVRPLISTFGTARSDQEVFIAAEVAGRVVNADRIRVGRSVSGPSSIAKPGQPASIETRGELLIRIDPETYLQRVGQAEALLAQDVAELEQLDQEVLNHRQLLAQKQQSQASALEQLELQRRLVREGAGRQTEFQRAELEYHQYESAALQLQMELNLEEVRRKRIMARQAAHARDLEVANLELQRADIHAPFSGVISQVLVEAGQYVRPGDNLLKLSNVDRVEIPLPLPVSRSGPVSELLKSGEQPLVQFAEHEAAECRWVGRVTRMSPVANELTRTVEVFAEVDNTQTRDMLRPGTFVQARIESIVLPGAMLIPREAIINGAVFVCEDLPAPARHEPSGSDSFPVEEATAIARRREVRVSGQLDAFALIASGLAPGDRVVLTNLDTLTDGTPLHIVDERSLRTESQRTATPAFDLMDTTTLAEQAPPPPALNQSAARRD